MISLYGWKKITYTLFMFHFYDSIINILLFIVDMSSEGTSKQIRKINLSPQSRERSNESRRLQYQQNKDAINESRRATYNRKTSEATLQKNSIVPRKYHTMDDIMERTFTVDSSLSGYAPPHHNLVVRCSYENVHNIGETSCNREERHIDIVDENFHPNPSMCPIACFDGQRLQNIHGGGNDDILCDDLDDSLLGHLFDNLDPVARNKRPSNPASQSNVVPPRESIIPDSILRGTMEVTKLYFDFRCNSGCSTTFLYLQSFFY